MIGNERVNISATREKVEHGCKTLPHLPNLDRGIRERRPLPATEARFDNHSNSISCLWYGGIKRWETSEIKANLNRFNVIWAALCASDDEDDVVSLAVLFHNAHQ